MKSTENNNKAVQEIIDIFVQQGSSVENAIEVLSFAQKHILHSSTVGGIISSLNQEN